MHRILQKTWWAFGGVALLLAALTTFAGAPEGHPDSIDGAVVQPLKQVLEREGYGRLEFDRAVSAYLWDNRNRLATTNFPKEKRIDILVCLLVDKGYSSLEKFASSSSFRNWCNDMVR